MSKGYAPCCNLCCEGLARWCGGRGRARWGGEVVGRGEGPGRGNTSRLFRFPRGRRTLAVRGCIDRASSSSGCMHCTARAGHRPGPRRQGERAATLGGRCKAQARSMRVPTDTFDTFDSSSCPPPSIVAVAREVVSRRVEKWASLLSRRPFSSPMVHLARAHFSSTRAGKKSSSLGKRNLIAGKRSRFSYLPYVINGHQLAALPMPNARA